MVGRKVGMHELRGQFEPDTESFEQFQRQPGTGIEIGLHRCLELCLFLGPTITFTVNRILSLAREVENLLLVTLILGQFIVIKAPGIVAATQYLQLFFDRQGKERLRLPPDIVDQLVCNAVIGDLEKSPTTAGGSDSDSSLAVY